MICSAFGADVLIDCRTFSSAAVEITIWRGVDIIALDARSFGMGYGD
jgi:hypothetical protein